MSCIFGRIFEFFSRRPPEVDLENYILSYDRCDFVPYAFYNKHTDCIEVYFKDDSTYTSPLSGNVSLYLSQDNNEVVGVKVLNARRLLKDG